MAPPDRPPTHDLIDWPALAGDLRRAGLFAVLRRAEALAADAPRIGTARRPDRSIVDLAQEPDLGFAGSTLERLEFHHGRPRLYGHWLGLLGPMGPMPTHMSEFAAFERRYAKAQPFGDWLNLLSQRMLQLFYRAWAQSQPAAQADRPDDDGFAALLAALCGGAEGAHGQSRFMGAARLHYAGLFVGPRSAGALQDALGHLLRQKVAVLEYMPRWRTLEAEDRTCLGRSFATLGQDAVLGRRVFSVSDAFRVVVRAQNLDDYRSLLPGGARFAVAAEAIEAFKPTHLQWDLCIEIAEAEAPRARLDGTVALGWSSWLKRADGVVANPRRRRRAGTAMGALDSALVGPVRSDAHLRKTSHHHKRTSAP